MRSDFREKFINTTSLSDKIYHHGYQRIYPWFLNHLINTEPVILEIGFFEGKSIALWNEYLNNPIIHVCDINAQQPTNDYIFHKLDQSKQSDWEFFKKLNNNLEFDFILDDGSHIPEHQLLTLNNIWPLLKGGGVYIIEDIETSYWNRSNLYGYDFNAKKTSIFKSLIGVIDIINKKISSVPNSSSPIEKKLVSSVFNFAEEVEILSFGYNSIILIKKEKKYEDFYKSEYNIPLKINETAKSENFIKKIKYLVKNIVK